MYFESKGIWGATLTSLPMQHSLEKTLMNDGIYLYLNNTHFLIFIKKIVDGLYIPQPNGQHVTIALCGTTAWFDEKLHHVTFGECRG